MKYKYILITTLICSVLYPQFDNLWALNVGSGLCQESVSDIGMTYTEAIKIINDKNKLVEVKIYQTDYLFFSDGTNQYGDPGKASRSNASWIGKLPQRFSIPPGQTSSIQYSIKVPNDQSLSGSYWSMVMIEEVNEEDMEALSSGKRQLGIRQLIRFGVQVVTHIGSSGSRQLEFRGLKLVKGDDKRYLQVNMENSGTRALRPTLWIDFYSEDGSYAKKISGEQRRIYPECSVMQKLDLSEIPAGNYKAVIVADAGEETVFGTSFSIQLKE